MTAQSNNYRIQFFGATQEVTGSCHCLTAHNKKILLDCGMRQGGGENFVRLAEEQFPFNPKEIDAVILSHAHLDHSGMLPRLIKEGFAGPIYCTPETKSLLKILLEDAAHLYFNDVVYENVRRARFGGVLIAACYSAEDVQRVLTLCKTISYDAPLTLSDGVVVTLHDAGHILGSAIVEVRCIGEQKTKTLVFSGDLGNSDAALMAVPAVLENADVVLMEGTYGDRNHKTRAETYNEFLAILAQAKKDQGNILIPTFAVGRTQDLLFELGCLYHQGLLEGWRIFLDSPMAQAVTEIYDQYKNFWDQKSLTEFLPTLTISKSVEDSKAINQVKQGAIILAGSGMCTGGRIRHHFRDRLWHANNHVIFVGFQAVGTLGRHLIDGAKKVHFNGEEIVVKSQLHTLGGYSAHAGQQQLLDWAGHFKTEPVFWLVHGEEQSLQTLADVLWQQKGIQARIATKGASFYF